MSDDVRIGVHYAARPYASIGEPHERNILEDAAHAARALRSVGLHDEAQRMVKQVMDATSYDDARQIILAYVVPS